MKILVAISLFILGCNSSQTVKKDRIVDKNVCFAYPMQIDNVIEREFYDSTRWFIYTMHCDKPYLPKYDSLFKTFGELSLKFENIIIMNDTIEINFSFFDDNIQVLPSMTRDFRELTTGVGFDVKTKRKIYMGSVNGFTVVSLDTNSRYQYPLQPEVINYIKANQDKIDNCFKELAIKNGINFHDAEK